MFFHCVANNSVWKIRVHCNMFYCTTVSKLYSIVFTLSSIWIWLSYFNLRQYICYHYPLHSSSEEWQIVIRKLKVKWQSIQTSDSLKAYKVSVHFTVKFVILLTLTLTFISAQPTTTTAQLLNRQTCSKNVRSYGGLCLIKSFPAHIVWHRRASCPTGTLRYGGSYIMPFTNIRRVFA